VPPIAGGPRLKFNEEQLQAIESEDSFYAIRAAAGSGKTSVLVAKYLRLIDQGLRADQILTITFTNKAAGEMRERIIRELKARGQTEQAQIAETGPIQTIHAFCERLLRENALMAGIDPDFEPCPGSVVHQLQDEAIRAASFYDVEDHPLIQKYIESFAGKLFFGGPRQLFATISKHVSTVLSNLRQSNFRPEDLDPIYAWPGAFLKRVEQDLLENLPQPIREEMATIDGTLAFRLSTAAKNQRAKSQWPELDWIWKKALQDTELEQAELTCGLAQLSLIVWRSVERELIRKQAFDFPLMESLAVRLLEQSAACRERMAHQFRAVLVDEAQDVNPIQYRLIRNLPVDPKMMVGDPQQAIFGFRMADVQLFWDLTRQVPTHSLSKNFRSQPGIIHFVNDLFSNLWRDQYEPMDSGLQPFERDPFGGTSTGYYEGVEIWPMPKFNAEIVAAHIATLIQEGETPSDIAVLSRTAAQATQVVQALTALGISTHFEGQSQVLSTHEVSRDLARALATCADPSDHASFLATLVGPFVDCSYDAAVVFAAHPGEQPDLSLLSEEDQQKYAVFQSWLSELQPSADRLPAWQVLSHLLNKTPYLQTIARRPEAKQSIANARRLLQRATEMNHLQASEFAKYLGHIQKIKEKQEQPRSLEADTSSVRVITMHAAKGLEFPVVVIPDLELGRRTMDLAVEPRSGLMTLATSKNPNPVREFLVAKITQREAAEHLRLVYVATTRAKRRLCMILAKSDHAKPVSRHLAALVGLENSPVLVRRSAEEMVIDAPE